MKRDFSKKMNNLNEDNKSNAKGRLIVGVVVLAVLVLTWFFNQ